MTQSYAACAEECASASEELTAQAETLKDAVTELQQLVGGNTAGTQSHSSATPKRTTSVKRSPAIAQRPVKAKSNGHSHAPQLQAPPRNGNGSAIPMADDFKNF